jgi:hypothetical protein
MKGRITEDERPAPSGAAFLHFCPLEAGNRKGKRRFPLSAGAAAKFS